jgi:two-component system KDP operon response regulator KdpE
MTSSETILVVEDELPIRRFIRPALRGEGYRMIEADSLRAGLLQASSHKPSVIIVDLGLPDGDGLELIRQVREWSRTPILVLSARGLETDKVGALDLGADDYLTKPFGVPELLARLRVALRHGRAQAVAAPEHPQTTIDQLVIDRDLRRVSLAGEAVSLTPIEYRLLTTLARAPGRVFTHCALIEAVWGGDGVESHLVRVHMANLRRKLEQDSARPRYLLTEPGVGYRLADS